MANFTTYNALNAIRKGKPVIVYEPEENELSMMIPAKDIAYKNLVIMKRYASGDIGVFISHELAEKLGLPFLYDIITSQKRFIFKNVKRNSLSVLIDHIKAKTGSSNEDKLMLIKETALVTRNKKYEKYKNIIAVPGHLKFFVSSKGLLETREGHTELNVSLALLSGMSIDEIVLVACTLQNPSTGKMMRIPDVKKFNDLKNIPIVKKKDVLKAWEDRYGK